MLDNVHPMGAGVNDKISRLNADKQRKLITTARSYLRLLHNPEIAIRFDIVEVLLNDGEVAEIRHQPNAFAPGRR